MIISLFKLFTQSNNAHAHQPPKDYLLKKDIGSA